MAAGKPVVGWHPAAVRPVLGASRRQWLVAVGRAGTLAELGNRQADSADAAATSARRQETTPGHPEYPQRGIAGQPNRREPDSAAGDKRRRHDHLAAG